MERTPQNSLSYASKVMGIIAIATSFFGIGFFFAGFSSFFGIGFVFAAFAIIFAALSKTKDNHFTPEGKLGTILGITTLVLTISFIVFIFVNQEAHALLNQRCQEIYHMSFDEIIEAVKNGEQVQLPNSPMFIHQ